MSDEFDPFIPDDSPYLKSIMSNFVSIMAIFGMVNAADYLIKLGWASPFLTALIFVPLIGFFCLGVLYKNLEPEFNDFGKSLKAYAKKKGWLDE